MNDKEQLDRIKKLADEFHKFHMEFREFLGKKITDRMDKEIEAEKEKEEKC